MLLDYSLEDGEEPLNVTYKVKLGGSLTTKFPETDIEGFVPQVT